MANPRILIIGGGFAGVKCAKTLRKYLRPNECEIVVFNRENHMVFHPLLAEVAGAAVDPKNVAAPLRQLLQHVYCRTEDVLSLDLDNSLIEYESHDGTRRQMEYNHVVISCGNSVNLGLIPGMDDNAFGLKTIGDALAVQAHVMEQMEKAEVCDDLEQKRRYLSFIIVGGGFSGVEVAGEINNLVRTSRKFFRNISLEDITVTIVHSRDQILPEVSPSLREFAQKKMEQAGVRLELGATAAYATQHGVALKSGKFLDGKTIVCTIGSTTLPFIQRLSVTKNRDRLVTNLDMSLPRYHNAWAIGDCAAVTNAYDGNICPTVGQFAERQGAQVASNIVARMRGKPTAPFSYKMIGSLCSIGGQDAVAEILGCRISGFPAWFLWRGVYLMKLPSFMQKIKVGIEWGCDLVFPRPLAHLKADRSRRICRAYYPAGDYIFRTGEPATDFYVLEHGEVEILGSPGDDGSAEIIAVLGPGDFFGERALIDSSERSSSVRARTEVEVVVLGRSVFTQISAALGPLRDAIAQAVRRRTNIWKHLNEVREVLDTIPLKHLLEPLPDDPLSSDCRLHDAIDRINRERLDLCCVVDDNKCLIGVVTRSDLFRAIEVAAALPAGSELNVGVQDIMVRDPITVTMKDTAALALMTMREHGLKSLPVVDSHKTRIARGYVRIENLMDCIVKRLLVSEKDEQGRPTGKVGRLTKETMQIDIGEVLEKIRAQHR